MSLFTDLRLYFLRRQQRRAEALVLRNSENAQAIEAECKADGLPLTALQRLNLRELKNDYAAHDLDFATERDGERVTDKLAVITPITKRRMLHALGKR